MKIIPSAPTADLTYTERQVFGLFKSVEWGRVAVALSSVNLSAHEKKRWGETDFVIVSEHGLLVVEVKGGDVSCHNGEWRYATRQGIIKKHESPFAQAHGNFQSIQKHIAGNAGLGIESRMPCGFCVIFAGMRRNDLRGVIGGPELPSELSGASEDLENPSAFKKYLNRVTEYWQAKEKRVARWDDATVNQVVGFLRPEFDRAVPLALRLRRAREERVHFTQEQYELLDHLASEPRLFVTGGAGCGKTFLGLELARRASQEGLSVAFITGTESLARYIRDSVAGAANVRVASVREVTNEKVPPNSVDLLILDEGQQVTSLEVYCLLDEMLLSGMERGRWVWFGDYARQVALDSDVDEEVSRLLKSLSRHQHLFQNCRNTPQLISAAETLSGVKLGKALVRGAGPPLHWLSCARRHDIANDAATQLKAWLSAEVAREDIVLLYASEEGLAEAQQAAREAGLSAVLWREAFIDRSRKLRVGYASIREFRGLESEYVQVFGLDDVKSVDELRALAYIALTRATFGASIASSRALKERLMAMSTVEGMLASQAGRV